MLTSEIVFDYVWQHFCSLYPAAEKLRVTYGANAGGKLEIADHGLTFLVKKVPYPEKISWLTWQEKALPFLFENDESPLFADTGETIKINADIIAGSFYFLSGWQEVYATARDKFNRFPYRESLQFKHNFVEVPVVNYYFDILKTALEKAYQVTLPKPAVWGDSEFTTFLSHDIDRLQSGWKVEGKRQLKQGNFGKFINLAIQKFTGKDHWQNLEKVTETVKKHGAVSTFFWLPQQGKFQNHPNADYDILKPEYQQEIKKLTAAGFENGLHGSFGTSENVGQLNAELQKFGAGITGNRFHYLTYNPQKTPSVLADSGLSYHCSLGFAEHFGFRNAYCFPFRPFNFSTLKPYPFLEIPLNLMDATLWHPNYLQLKPEEILPAITPMLKEIGKFGGCFGLLWHNENFSELNSQNGLAVFEQIMEELTRMKSGFKTGNQVATIFRDKI